VVVGYADVRGSEKYNLALSEMRAEAREDYLVSRALQTTRLRSAERQDRQLDAQQVENLQSQDRRSRENG